MQRFVGAILFLSVVAAGCGGDKKPAATDKPKTGEGTEIVTEYKDPGTSAPTTAPTTPTTGSTNPTTAPDDPANPGPQEPTTTTTRKPFPVEMKLGKACVKRGVTGDSQSLTVKSRPDDMIAYSTEYSDGTNEMTNPEYSKTGGTGHGDADDEGDFKAEWKIPESAPSGVARLHVIADGRIHSKLTFRVVGPTESC